MRSRKLPNGDVLIGHRSAQASHLGNIAYVQRRRLRYNPDREEILPLMNRRSLIRGAAAMSAASYMRCWAPTTACTLA